MQTSLDLYEYVLPVYQNEYFHLAKLYDQGASKEEKESYSQAVMNKYALRYEELYDKLITQGKVYAQKHNIKVEWRM